MSKKILVVDDELGVRESLKLILGDHYNLILTEDGAQALDCLKNAPDIGLILMDIKMPEMNGLEVLAEIKKVYPTLPVVMITGYKCVETAAEAVKLGACGYIVKPFKSDEILKKVKSVLK
ncbi:MAG TPA: response regulator [Candidatus Omnitrophota bacterium]|nr:response regulator [Candidatus Omnitrophota bacterium]